MGEVFSERPHDREVLVACQFCGSGIPDGVSTCPVCGMSTVEQPELVAVAATPYLAGPSFVALDEQELDFSGMPGWLQSFGESVAASAIMPNGAVGDTQAGVDLDGQPALPSWLEEPRQSPAGAPGLASLGSDALRFDSDSIFISEDDLPEWLRSIGDEPTGDDVVLGVVSSTTSNGAFVIPPVSRAWVTTHQMVALAPGETLFALIAGEEIAPVSSIHSEVSHHVEVQTPITIAGDTANQVETPPDKQPQNMRVLLLAASVMVLILLVLVMMMQR